MKIKAGIQINLTYKSHIKAFHLFSGKKKCILVVRGEWFRFKPELIYAYDSFWLVEEQRKYNQQSAPYHLSSTILHTVRFCAFWTMVVHEESGSRGTIRWHTCLLHRESKLTYWGEEIVWVRLYIISQVIIRG